MRVLQVHNFYSSNIPSGENEVVNAELELLKKKGVDVEKFYKNNDKLVNAGKLSWANAALHTPWNIQCKNEFKNRVSAHEFDVIHVHNTFPLISPSIFYGAGKNVARVMTLHNYRLVCPAGIPLRDGRVCTECIEKRSSLPSLKYGCYRGSRLATLPIALNVSLHRALGTWLNQVDAFICLSTFQKEVMADSGFPREKLYVKPNFFSGNPEPTYWSDRKPFIVYAGRLSKEKGLRTLFQAWASWGREAPELRIIGDGDLRQELETVSKENNLPVRFLGRLSSSETQKQISEAYLQILPSEWFETFGLVVTEAFAHGTPAAVSRIGALPSIVEDGRNGVVFEPFNAKSLLDKVREVWSKPDRLKVLGENARMDFEAKYTESVNSDLLLRIYEKAISRRRNGN